MISATDKILITGGAGLIGSHISDSLLRQYNPEIIVLDNFSRGRRENLRTSLMCGHVDIVEGDVRDVDVVHEVVKGVDIIFHLAGMKITQCAEDPRLAVEVLVNGTFNVLEAAALSGVRKVVIASSSESYDAAEPWPTRPYTENLSGATKLFMEDLLRNFHRMYGTDYVALRYSSVYGPRMRPNGICEILARWIERLAQRQACVIAGDGQDSIDLVFVEDIARAAIMAGASNVTNEVLNIAGSTENTLAEVALTLGRVMGSDLPLQYTCAKQDQPYSRRLPDTDRVAQLLGFRPQVPLEDGLRHLVAWWERHRSIGQLEMV